MKRLLFLFVGFFLFYLSTQWAFASMEDCFLIDVDELNMEALRDQSYVNNHLSAQASGIRVQKYISQTDELTARVRLTLQQMDTGTLVFDKNYGYQSGTFDSGDIFLPYVDNRTIPYLVTVYVEDWVYALPFMHLQPRLTYNGACTYGVRMYDYQPGITSDWLMGTMVDINELRARGSMSIPLCASNAYMIGEAIVTLTGDNLSVELVFASDAHVEVHQSNIYFITNVNSLSSIGSLQNIHLSYGVGETIKVGDAQSALLYLPMIVSFDSTGLSGFSYNLQGDGNLQFQLKLWMQNMREGTELPELINPNEWTSEEEDEPVLHEFDNVFGEGEGGESVLHETDNGSGEDADALMPQNPENTSEEMEEWNDSMLQNPAYWASEDMESEKIISNNTDSELPEATESIDAAEYVSESVQIE